MKLEINTKELIQGLSKALGAIKRKATLPIIENVLLEITKENVVFTGTDLEITSKVTMEHPNEEEGSYMIDATKLKEILLKLPDVTITLNFNDTSMDIISFNGDFVLPLMGDPQDFPKIENKDGILTEITTTTDLASMFFGAAKDFVGTDELRPVMNGVCMDIKKNKLFIVSTNAHMLLKLETPIKVEVEDNTFLIPSKGAYLISKMKKDNECVFSFSEKNVYVKSNNEYYIIRLTEGKYPNYNSIIPSSSNITIQINKEKLYNAIDMISLVGNASSNMQILDLEKDKLSVNAINLDANSQGNVVIEDGLVYDGDEKFKIGFNSKFMNTILGNITHENVEINFQDQTKAIIIYPMAENETIKKALFLQMPMLITD